MGDRDWFQVQLVAGTTYIVDLQGAQAGGGRWWIRIYACTTALKFCWPRNDDIILINRDHLSFTARHWDLLPLRPVHFDDSYTGTYRMSIHPNHAPTVTVANVTTTSGQSIAASSLLHGLTPTGTR